MKSALSILVLASFIGVAVFGIIAMNHGDRGHGGCIGAAAQGAPCPEKDPLGFIAFHLAAFKKFSIATFDAVGLAMALLAIVALLLLAAIRDMIGRSGLAGPAPSAARRIARGDIYRFTSSAPFVRWLSLAFRRDFVPAL